MLDGIRSGIVAALALLAVGDEAKAGGEPPFTVVALGTSISAWGGWQKPLAETLAACLGRAVHVRTIAGAGKASDWGLMNTGRVTALKPDVVIVEFAINDADIRHWIDLRKSRENTVGLIRALRKGNPQAKVILMTTNPVTGWKRLLRPRLDRYYRQYRRISQAYRLPLIDGRAGWERLPATIRDTALPDGVHPRPEIFAESIIPDAARALNCR